MKGNPETMGSANASRRHSSPIVTGGRLTEPSGKGRVHSNGHVADTPEPQKVSHVSEVGIRRPVMSSSAASDSTGSGRTISKKFFEIP
ncbi:GASTRIC MUCIN-LIKE PROTEIN [Salix viminalis]|uniref:GASTRIC MUCIN-LIKE PROTEIN n=1 Tax=Salix viminalis TaxID=40686 RepID=A0A6N2KZP1_SALVM|nr:GASTRIC MUCIN-LIKE PROTEIN [Salix viminalis]